MKTYAFVLTALLAGAAIAADAPMDSAKTTTVKKHHKMHKKAMADYTVTTASAGADTTTTTTVKKHHKKHKKAMMADSSAAK